MGWPHREVQPDGAMAIFFYQQFIEVLLRFVADVEQDSRIADELFHIFHANIHCAARQMIAIGNPTNRPIQLRRSIAGVDAYPLFSVICHSERTTPTCHVERSRDIFAACRLRPRAHL